MNQQLKIQLIKKFKLIRFYLNNQELKNCGKAGDILGQVEAVFQKREKQDRKKAKMYTNMQKIAILWD